MAASHLVAIVFTRTTLKKFLPGIVKLYMSSAWFRSADVGNAPFHRRRISFGCARWQVTIDCFTLHARNFRCCLHRTCLTVKPSGRFCFSEALTVIVSLSGPQIVVLNQQELRLMARASLSVLEVRMTE